MTFAAQTPGLCSPDAPYAGCGSLLAIVHCLAAHAVEQCLPLLHDVRPQRLLQSWPAALLEVARLLGGAALEARIGIGFLLLGAQRPRSRHAQIDVGLAGARQLGRDAIGVAALADVAVAGACVDAGGEAVEESRLRFLGGRRGDVVLRIEAGSAGLVGNPRLHEVLVQHRQQLADIDGIEDALRELVLLVGHQAQRVDADDAPALVEQRPAAVARIDRGGVLDEPVVAHVLHVRQDPPDCADAVGGLQQHSRHDAVAGDIVGGGGVADRGNLRGRVGGVVREHDGLAEDFAVGLDDRHVLGGVGGNQARRHERRLPGREERHLDRLAAVDDVVVGGDDAMVVDDEPGAGRRPVVGLDHDAHHAFAHLVGVGQRVGAG